MKEYDLNTPLMKIGIYDGQPVFWTMGNAVEGTQIFGGTGAGKTSGSGEKVALSLLGQGCGGLILTVKADEKEMWVQYCKRTGRSDDLIIVDTEHHNYFNFLDYEGRGESITENIVQVLKTVIRSGEEVKNGSSDPFWGESLEQLLYNLIDLCKLAYGSVSIQKMYDVLQVLPTAETDYTNTKEKDSFVIAYELAAENIKTQIARWKSTFTTEVLNELFDNPEYEQILGDAVPDYRTFKFVDYFCVKKFPLLPEKTRMTIEFSVTGFLFRLLRDPVFSLFCRHASTFTPDDCLKGKIILLNLPIKRYHKVGRDSQLMFKYIWQRAMERGEEDKCRVPIFLWSDEAQNFLHEHDASTQATARSSRIATVCLSQNLPNYFANMGGAKSKHLVDTYLGTLATKIFHANADIETNNYASELIGDAYFIDPSKSVTHSKELSMGTSQSLKLERIVRPESFSQLRTGSSSNGGKVEAYILLQRAPINGSPNYFMVEFNQNKLLNINTENYEQNN